MLRSSVRLEEAELPGLLGLTQACDGRFDAAKQL
jgi:hypothetical protein